MVAYRHDIDDIIIIELARSPWGPSYDEPLRVQALAFTTLFRMVKRTYPTISKTTVQGHLDKMIAHGTLQCGVPVFPCACVSKDGGTSRRTLYYLSKNTYVNIRDSQIFPRVKSNREPRTK